MTIVILLNGPKHSGKSTLADAFERETASCVQLGFSWYVKVTALVQIFGDTPELAAHRMQEVERADVKDTMVIPAAGNRSPRQLYLDTGETIRKEHGNDFIPNKWLGAAGRLLDHKYIIAPDCRCIEERAVATKLVGSHRVLTIRVNRFNTNWEDDFGYQLPGAEEVNNSGTVNSMVAQLNMRLRAFEARV